MILLVALATGLSIKAHIAECSAVQSYRCWSGRRYLHAMEQPG